jgi:hypothetical protein
MTIITCTIIIIIIIIFIFFLFIYFFFPPITFTFTDLLDNDFNDRERGGNKWALAAY